MSNTKVPTDSVPREGPLLGMQSGSHLLAVSSHVERARALFTL